MAEQKLNVIVKSIDLVDYTFTITSNKKRYPAKYRSLIERIQNKSMDIYELLLDANRLPVDLSLNERILLQTNAISSCDKLSCYVELSLNKNLIGFDTAAFWQRKISDVKYMTIAWREKDKMR